MDIKDIQNLIRFIAKSGVSEVKLEIKDIKITVKTGPAGTYSEVISSQGTSPMQLIPHQQNLIQTATPLIPGVGDAARPKSDTAEERYVPIKSPMIGTFYRRPAPDKDVFAEVGKSVKKGDVVCVIEAMKLFNEIESDISGTIVKVLVEDMSPVEFDQPLFLVDPI